MLVALLLIAWWLSGFLSFVYWYHNDYDVTTAEIPLACVVGLLGPTAFVVGLIVHGKGEGKIIFRRRKQ